uniref:Uncharacterized protein n=1 Tax=Eutreptiella gymnastica TaxID=73025 RepID=A0A7S4D2S9_9EUGL
MNIQTRTTDQEPKHGSDRARTHRRREGDPEDVPFPSLSHSYNPYMTSDWLTILRALEGVPALQLDMRCLRPNTSSCHCSRSHWLPTNTTFFGCLCIVFGFLSLRSTSTTSTSSASAT